MLTRGTWIVHVDDVVARVRAYRDQMGWSNNHLSKQAKVSEAAVRNIDDPQWNCELKTLRKLCDIIPDGFTCPRNKTNVPQRQG